jgi:hypothetical protein
MTNVEHQKRENKILLGFLERPALRWLAAHMPAWVTPDILTLDRDWRICADFRQLYPHQRQSQLLVVGQPGLFP